MDGGEDMAIRLVITITAAPGKGSDLAQVLKTRCAEVVKEPGCQQFEAFQSVVNPDRTRPPLRPELRVGDGEREDYEYNRTR
jgi:hypothetical protein